MGRHLAVQAATLRSQHFVVARRKQFAALSLTLSRTTHHVAPNTRQPCARTLPTSTKSHKHTISRTPFRGLPIHADTMTENGSVLACCRLPPLPSHPLHLPPLHHSQIPTSAFHYQPPPGIHHSHILKIPLQPYWLLYTEPIQIASAVTSRSLRRPTILFPVHAPPATSSAEPSTTMDTVAEITT